MSTTTTAIKTIDKITTNTFTASFRRSISDMSVARSENDSNYDAILSWKMLILLLCGSIDLLITCFCHQSIAFAIPINVDLQWCFDRMLPILKSLNVSWNSLTVTYRMIVRSIYQKENPNHIIETILQENLYLMLATRVAKCQTLKL